MAIELYYTLRSDRKPRRWRDSNIAIGGSMQTFLRFMLHMEKKYLPSLPSTFPELDKPSAYHSRWNTCMGWTKDKGEHPMQEVWDLQLSPNATQAERLTMASMMDKAYFNVIDFPKVAEAWLEVDREMNENEENSPFGVLINAIRKLVHETPGINTIAVHWSSVVNFYESYGKNDKGCYDFVEAQNEVEQTIKMQVSNE